ncbi:hypothetical protein T440DRAFT_442338 [Plenodomus tracheiphilus IPT5]|uniref:RING-type domain-containing protein n=1 Tax=Plenodomus tracheiphilus IPT5 TaxID=1408161 RepID=A0A6A7BHL9_9PLEO|nr:hypothetical protein T440DRAFT_442338 [Plenodomus tracheiphilus IPT5]
MDQPRESPTPPAGSARPKNSRDVLARTSSSSMTQPQNGAQPSSATMASSSRATRANTPTASRSASKLVDDAKQRPASRDSLKAKMLKKEETPQPSKSETQLKALKTDFDSLRSHLTCKICDHLLYQPYTISCGHTYCYTCLCTWFVGNKARKTCPDCRIVVKELPAPAYVIRDMTGIFIARAELLPSGETVEQHKKWQKDEADAVQLDKDNADARDGGLFKGCFKPHPHHGRGPSLQVVRDQEDGVDRCPVCTWELEDGGCTQCGLIFDETGEVSWGDSFTGFSDMDEMSEHDTEGLDAMDMEDVDYDGYDEAMDGWGAYPPDQNSFMMRRFLDGAIPGGPPFLRRRLMTHSEAGSRHSYSQSVMSDVYGDEMDTLQEEDEEEEEDSSMNDFIDDDEVAASSSASAESSTPGPAPQPSSQRVRATNRARRVVESETSSTISSVIEEEDEDEEDQGPIRRGTRNPSQSRILNRANGSRSSHGPSSVASTDASTEDLDEDEQSLLREEGWMRQRDDDEMGEEDEDDSDGGRTTVGWEPLANSNDRSRMGGSLTPTADQPRPSAPIRPPSRTGNVRVINTSRGLRRRSSVLSSATASYEDGEADDDDSDQDGDLDMAMNALRARRSQAHLRGAAISNPAARFTNAGPGQAATANELDTDDNSDNSQTGGRQRNPRTQRREYDPRISWMFAAHQQALQQHHMQDVLIDVETRSITPLARPRTRNRNRTSPAQTYSPFMAPARLRTPLMEDNQAMRPGSRGPMSPPRRTAMSPAQFAVINTGNPSRFERAPSVSSNSNASAVMTPSGSTTSTQHSIDDIAQVQASAALDMIDRPQSRVGPRPTSANSRRNSAGFSPVNPPFPHTAMGLHVQGSALPPFQARGGNPWAAYVQARNLRSRNSRQVLREQSSVATLRPASSRVNLRDAVNPPPNMRPQVSRMNLRSQPSRRQLNNQSSTRTLRASEHARPPPSPTQEVQTQNQPTPRPLRQTTLTPDERDTRARELVETRRRAIVPPVHAPARTNPFTQGFQRPGNPIASTIIQQPPTNQHVRSNSNESMQSVNSSGTAQGAPTSPALGRRRSNRNMLNAPQPGAVLPTQQGQQYAQSPPPFTNSYYRPRSGQMANATGVYEGPLNSNSRALNPMMAGPLI